MSTEGLVMQLKMSWEFFNRSSACLEEKDAGFRPYEESLTVTQQIAHVGQCVDWFMDGAFRAEGFNLDFEGEMKRVTAVTSLAEAREWVDQAHARALEVIEGKTMEEMMVPLADGPIMGGAPRVAIVSALCDHTAHHRGALAVCSRLCGHTPAMPYGGEEM